ncbi:MAG: glycosyltransferase [Proteobacteria bacterium]|nr:glycosyltransferase [Pseudomonadota bacterium]
MLLSIIFSFRNEESNIPELVRRVTQSVSSVQDVQLEMIFVNDDSTDRSLDVLKELQQSHPITIINMSRRFGVTPCVIAGFSRAKGDAVIYMDTDLQDPPELIPQMITKFKEGADVVHTTRSHREGENALKMWLTKKAYGVINLFSDIALPENTGDFKLLSRRVLNEILALSEYDPYMRGLSIWVGFKQDFVYYTREARFTGETHMPLFGKGPVREFLRGLTSFSAVPLYLSFFAGVVTSLISGLLIIYALLAKLFGVSYPGSTGVLIAVAFFSGIILMTNGVIGLYIARIYNEIKNRPRYIIRETIEPEIAAS